MKLIHFSGLEKNFDCSSFNNIILSWNLCGNDNYLQKFKKKEIFYVSHVWEKNKLNFKKSIIKFKKKILHDLGKKLNFVNKVNYSHEAWEIMLEPWITTYLETNYFKWLIIDQIKKENSNFKYLKINVKNKIPDFDTLQFTENCFKDDTCNHLAFQQIIEYQKNNKIAGISIKKKFSFKDKFFCRNINYNFFLSLYEKILDKLKINKALINLKIRKTNLINLSLRLKYLPYKGINIFDRRKLDTIFHKLNYLEIKRKKIIFKKNKSRNFLNYILERIKYDLPRCFVEDFNEIKKIHLNKLQNTNLVVSDTIHKYNTTFKSWLAFKRNNQHNFKIITSDHGGIYGNGCRTYDYDLNISDLNIKSGNTNKKKQITLPSLFLNKENLKLNLNKNILIICHNTSKYPRYFLTGPISEQIVYQFEQVKLFMKNLNKTFNNKIFIRPYTVTSGWNLTEKYKCLVKKNNIVLSDSIYQQLKNKSFIKIVTYPKTAYLESLITGPTFLLFNRKHYFDTKLNEKFMNILFKNKLAFENGKDLAIHIKNIESNINEWWYKKKIQDSINLFLSNTCKYNNEATKIWARALNKKLDKF